MKVKFVAGFSPIVRDLEVGKKLYVGALGLPLEGDYPMTEKLDGVKHFGLWALADAAETCFGTREWPKDVPVPQGNVEFDMESAGAVREAEKELQAKGYRLLHPTKTEPWGQTITRLLSPEGLLVGIACTLWHHKTESA